MVRRNAEIRESRRGARRGKRGFLRVLRDSSAPSAFLLIADTATTEKPVDEARQGVESVKSV
jgi:hypothetical protein